MSRNFASDQVLLDRLLLNDTEAFEELYRRYWYSLYTYSVKKLYSSDDARRIVRDIFIDLWQNRGKLPVSFSISQHLYTTIRKSVVESLSAKLNMADFNDTIEKDIAPGFSVKALQQARQPVRQKLIRQEPVRVIPKTELPKHHPRHFVTLTHLKWLFQTVTAKLL